MIIPYLIVALAAVLFVAAIFIASNTKCKESLHITETCKEKGDFFTEEQIAIIKRAWYCEGYYDRKNGVEPQFYVEDLQFKENSNCQGGEELLYVSNKSYALGYRDCKFEVRSIIESRLAELIGDAQPTPILRAELNELLNKIKNEKDNVQ